MLKHIVWWTLKDEAEGASGAENGRRMLDMLRGLEGRIPTLLSIEVTMDFLGSSTEPCQILLQSSHDDAEGLKAYAEHPEHMKCVEFIKKVVASRKAIDYIV
jgi:hypothetical protein